MRMHIFVETNEYYCTSFKIGVRAVPNTSAADSRCVLFIREVNFMQAWLNLKSTIGQTTKIY